MKRQDALSVGQIIEQAMEATGHRDDYDRQQACYLWQEVVGPTINRYTTRRWIDRDELHVCLSSASLKNELLYHTQTLIDKINALVGKPVISKIVIH